MNISLPQPHAAVARAATCATLVAAFADDEAVRTVYPADADYFDHFPGLVAATGGQAFEAGVVDRHPAGVGAALWLPPGTAPDPARIHAHLEASVPPGRRAALAAGIALQAALRPEAPHWSLPWIGVRPEAQGLGIGAALLRRGLARAEAEGLPAYLEATTRRGASFFAAHGFAAIGIVIAAGYPQITAMWRPAGR